MDEVKDEAIDHEAKEIVDYLFQNGVVGEALGRLAPGFEEMNEADQKDLMRRLSLRLIGNIVFWTE